MFSLGIYAWFGYKLPLEKRLKLIADAGFTNTCVWFGHEEDLVKSGKDNQIPELVRDAGLTLDNIHAPFWHSNYLWVEAQTEKDVIWRELMDALSFCARHHIPVMVMHLSAGKTPPPPNQSGLKLIRDMVCQAEDMGVTIAMENAEDYGNHYLEFVFSDIQSPNLGFCYDSSHDFIAMEFRGKALQKWGKLLAATHISDNQGINDDHLLPGRGTINWDNVVKQFSKTSFKGTFMLEVDGPEANKGFTAEEFLKTGYQKARQLTGMLEK